jgi:hypothetical protein
MNPVQLKALQKRIFTRAGLSAFGTFILNTLGVWLSLYSLLWWYDIPMHFLGGLFTTLLIISFLLRFKKLINLPNYKFAIIVLVLIFIFGLVWEVYEFTVITMIFKKENIPMDSLSDLFFDIAGGIEALFIYMRHRRIVLGE